jgi:hypothetical protein
MSISSVRTNIRLMSRVKNAWSYTSTPPYVFKAWYLVKHKDEFIFNLPYQYELKVNLPLCLIKQYTMKMYWGVEVLRYTFSASALGGEWWESRPGCFTPVERTPGIHWIGGWVGSTAILEAVEKRKIPSPRRESNSNSYNPARSQSLHRLSYRGSYQYEL